jgi:hypothetical protein
MAASPEVPASTSLEIVAFKEASAGEEDDDDEPAGIVFGRVRPMWRLLPLLSGIRVKLVRPREARAEPRRAEDRRCLGDAGGEEMASSSAAATTLGGAEGCGVGSSASFCSMRSLRKRARVRSKEKTCARAALIDMARLGQGVVYNK